MLKHVVCLHHGGYASEIFRGLWRKRREEEGRAKEECAGRAIREGTSREEGKEGKSRKCWEEGTVRNEKRGKMHGKQK